MEFSLVSLFFLLIGTVIGGFAFILGLSHLVIRHPGYRNFLLAIFWIGLGYYMIYSGVVESNMIVMVPGLYFTHYPLLLLGPPALYLFLKSLGQNIASPGKKEGLHLIPAILFLVIFLPVYFADSQYKAELASKPQKFYFLEGSSWSFGSLWTDFLKLLHSAPKASMLIYIVFLLRNSFFVGGTKAKRREIFGLRVISSMILSALVLSILSQFFVRYFFMALAFGLTLTSVVGMFLLEHRFKTFRSLVLKHSVGKVERSLSIQDRDALDSRLIRLMEEEFVYRDDTLTRDELARMLAIPSHQLSAILNKNFGMNFNTFLNKYRLKEARTLLIQEPDRTILSIAMEVGFGSKSTFNRVFSKYEGMTPEGFREISPGKK